MKPAVMYELRVLSGEQQGASSSVRVGDALRLGRAWSNDVVLQDAEDSSALLALNADGQLTLNADGGDCLIDGVALPAGELRSLALYTPFVVGGTRMAVGRIGAPQWAALFTEPEPEPEAATMPGAEVAEPLLVPAAPARSRANWAQRLLLGGTVLVAVSAGALTLAWAMGPASLSPAAQTEHLRQTLAHLGFGALNVEHRDGQLLVTGHLETQAQRTQLEQALASQSPARVAVWVNEQVIAGVSDVYRLNGVSAEVRGGGPGVVHVLTHESEPAALARVQSLVRRDVPGLQQLVAMNEAPATPPRAEPVLNDPGKRVSAIVPSDPAYVVTADGTRYFPGAMLPTGHRILSIQSDRVQIERDGVSSTLNF